MKIEDSPPPNPNTTATPAATPPSFSTNWKISGGDLDSTITFESSFSPVESEELEVERRFPLVLEPNHDGVSEPCEIKISFSQKHEIRQIYVRSTARVYEIYYEPAPLGGNEYLCTVRCSIAAVEEEDSLHATDTVEAALHIMKSSSTEALKERMTGESKSGSSDEDWVEVNTPESYLEHRNRLLAERSSNTGIFHPQDFYEATAEISDVDPCMSITLRLLSLQSKGCLYIDQVYVFADPIDSTDADYQGVQVGSSAGSALFAMLVPSLLQLSKSGAGRLEEKYSSNSTDKQGDVEVDSKLSSSTEVENMVQQGGKPISSLLASGDTNTAKFQELNGAEIESAQFNVQIENTASLLAYDDANTAKLQELNGVEAESVQSNVQIGNTNERTCSFVPENNHKLFQFESVMEQLLSRVSKIEDICMRFEENMLKPINNMETRLQRVEQQVDLLVKNSQHSGGKRFSAPTFSSTGSDYSHPCGTSDLEREITNSNKTYRMHDDTPISVSAPHFIPSLVVTAPEFSCGEEEENVYVTKPSEMSPKPKHALSIDDALAAALAGFSSTSVQLSDDSKFAVEENICSKPWECSRAPLVTGSEWVVGKGGNGEPLKFTQPLKVTSPEFATESNSSDGKVLLPDLFDGGEPIFQNGNIDLDKVHLEEAPEVVDGQNTFTEALKVLAPEFADEGSGNVSLVLLPEVPDSSHLEETPEVLDGYNPLTHTLKVRVPDIGGENSDSKVVDGQESTSCSIIKNDIDSSHLESVVCTKDTKEGAGAIPRSSSASLVNYEIPILEVEFFSSANSNAIASLETLLADNSDDAFRACFAHEIHDADVIAEPSNSCFEDLLEIACSKVELESFSAEVEGDGLEIHPSCITQKDALKASYAHEIHDADVIAEHRDLLEIANSNLAHFESFVAEVEGDGMDIHPARITQETFASLI